MPIADRHCSFGGKITRAGFQVALINVSTRLFYLPKSLNFPIIKAKISSPSVS
jgi:hypothetical protein